MKGNGPRALVSRVSGKSGAPMTPGDPGDPPVTPGVTVDCRYGPGPGWSAATRRGVRSVSECRAHAELADT